MGKAAQAETLDFPLWELDKTRLEEIVAHYRNRPKSSSTGNRISRDYAKHLLDAIWSVLSWLDESPRWKWAMPNGAKKINRTPVKLNQDRAKSRVRRVSKKVYSVAELAMIAGKMNTLEKLILGVSVTVRCSQRNAVAYRLMISISSIQKQVRSEIGFYSTGQRQVSMANGSCGMKLPDWSSGVLVVRNTLALP